MARKPIFDYPGGVYHIISRGNNRSYIFSSTEDKECFLQLLGESKKKLGFEFLGYVIMGNHYHLIMKNLGIPLETIMHRINSKFSRSYNTRNKRTGHVFESRYKGILVAGNRYLLSLLRYVHQNPVQAHICEKVHEYYWSSDKFYRNNIQNGIVDIDYILNIFSRDRAKAIEAYRDFMGEDKMERESIFENVKAIGKIDTTGLDEYIHGATKTLDEILKDIAEDDAICDAIKSGSRRRCFSRYKKKFVDAAVKSNYTMREIGIFIGISKAAVSKIFNAD